MKKTMIATLTALALLAGAAQAASIDSFFGNTVVVNTPDGAVINYHFDADGKVSAHGPDGQVMSGAWVLQGEELCITPDGGEQTCYPGVVDRAVGDTWTLTGPDGASQATLTLNAGR